MRPRLILVCAVVWLLAGPARPTDGQSPPADDRGGSLPTDAAGRPLNFDFESGTLKDWVAEGQAFANQPVDGDAVARRRNDMKSNHAGQFWIGSFERGGDGPQGTLTSVPFRVTKPFASLLIAGGAADSSRLEIVAKDTGAVLHRLAGDNTETLKPIAVDLSAHRGKDVFLRLVDASSDGWGHVNFDDFRLHDTKPNLPNRGSAPLKADEYAHEGLSPEDAAKAMTLPEGFHATLSAGEPEVVQPIAMAIDDRGRVWVAEAYSYPRRVPENQAKDRILIFEDTDGDGRFDRRKVFADKLNLVSGIEVGFGGVWVGAAPEFYFIPDKDGDDIPDGPATVLLDGWGAEDTHETLNSFQWGPDGWLYGCHGVFTHSRVGKPGTPNAARVPINAGIWRYHPVRHEFEVFAHGTSNPWGIDFDEHGQAFETACVIPHLYHMIQGGRYERQAGQHFNPHTYDDIKTIADHRHYLGANPHGGNDKSDSAGGGHAHCGALIYLGDAFPKEYRGSLFMNNIHGARLNRDLLEPKGSGFVGQHAADFLMANDRWSQIISLKPSRDGGFFMIDWYDKNQCHHNTVDGHDRTNGRVFKVTYGDRKPNTVEQSTTFWKGLTGKDHWVARRAVRQLRENAALGRPVPAADLAALKTLAFGSTAPSAERLYGLWGLHAAGQIQVDDQLRGLKDGDPYLRAWTIQLACETGRPADPVIAAFRELAKSDPSPVVRLYLASACQRLPLADRWDILAGLVAHGEDAEDHNLPLMIWYAAEPLAEADPSRAIDLAMASKLPTTLAFMARRVASIGKPEALAALVDRLGQAKTPAHSLAILDGINTALKGTRQAAMPTAWERVSGPLRASTDPKVRSQAMALAVTFGDPAALKELEAIAVDKAAPLPSRRDAIDSLTRARPAGLAASLIRLIEEPALRGLAIRGLALYDDPSIPPAILKGYAEFAPAERRDALATLASRATFAKALLDAVGSKSVASTDLTADLVRQLRNLKDAGLDRQIADVWGSARDSTADKAKAIAKFKTLLSAKPTKAPDAMLGRAVYVKTCGTCHVLFGVGGNVGPELTGSNRADLEYVLSNVIDPSALIGKDYQAHILALSDGRVLTGIVREEQKDAITLVTANETIVVPKAEIEERKLSDQSMMPEGQWETLGEHEVRSLVAYLASPSQVPMLATKENASSFGVGKDFSYWTGDASHWSIQGEELVGKSAGLQHNNFLASQFAAEDFHLTFQVKLVGNEGNSGVQFRSLRLADGEFRGYQADIGPGWWGKIYEENGRDLLGKELGERHLKPGEWNTYEVIAKGDHVETRINGQVINALDDPAGAKRGIFGLQLHSGGPTEIRFRDFQLQVIDPK